MGSRRPRPGPRKIPADVAAAFDQALLDNGFTSDHVFRKQLTAPPDSDGRDGEFADRSKIVQSTLPPFRPRMGYKVTPPPDPSRVYVLREAEKLITGERNQTYGEPTTNFTNIAALLNVQLAHKLRDGEQFTSADVAQIMIQTKMGRLIAQPKRDNFVDIAGYAACAWECQETEEKK